MNRPLHMKEIKEREKPLSEQFRLAGLQHADADGAATLLEELKTATLAELKNKLIAEQGPTTDAAAERIVKAGEDWKTYIKTMCEGRHKANRLKVEMEYVKMRYHEWQCSEANARAERRMG